MKPSDPWYPQENGVHPFPGVTIRDMIAAMIFADGTKVDDMEARKYADDLCAELADNPPDW